MKITHERKGFTLVEVIVVSVIVGILAVVAVPVYLAYVKNSRQESVHQLTQTAAAAANGFYRNTGRKPALSNLNLFYDGNQYLVVIDSPYVKVQMKVYTEFKDSVAFTE